MFLKNTTKKGRIKKSDILNITGQDTIVKKHDEIVGITVINDKNTFPISWIQKSLYCEYQIYLEHFKGIKAKPTFKMIEGSKEHHKLEKEFLEKAEPATFEEMIDFSTAFEVHSREFPVFSNQYGIHGLIDEIIMSPDSFIIIDDKPGKIPYLGNMFQVFGYCLAFKEMIFQDEIKTDSEFIIPKRKIYAAIRERGTNNIFWIEEFNQELEIEIIKVVNRLHNLIDFKEDFIATENPNKCKSCRFKFICDRKK
ncbi:MAG: PD-(D/E)XK nuclease family protein [Candidatus Sericytochromatia bacterium]